MKMRLDWKSNYNDKTIYNISINDLLDKYKNFNNLHIVKFNGSKGQENKKNEEVFFYSLINFEKKLIW